MHIPTFILLNNECLLLYSFGHFPKLSLISEFLGWGCNKTRKSGEISPLSCKVVDLIKHLKKTKERHIENYANFFKKKTNKHQKTGNYLLGKM